VTLAWAALSNLIGFDIGWVIFALFQIYLAFRIFHQYRRFQNIESEYIKITANGTNAGTSSTDQAARLFPWIGSLLSCSSIIGLFLMMFIVIMIAIGTEGTSDPPGYISFVEGLIVNFGVLGFSVSLSSLLSKFRPKALAIVGLVAGILTLVIELAFIFL